MTDAALIDERVEENCSITQSRGLHTPAPTPARHQWAHVPIRERIRRVCALRHVLAEAPSRFTDAIDLPFRRSAIETLTAELIPLADACRFLQRDGAAILRKRPLGVRGRPAWLFGVSAHVRRAPFGTVLIIGPKNYPLMLPGIQIVQALVAGNRVLFKPAPGTAAIATVLVAALHNLGVPRDVLTLLDESPHSIEPHWHRVDKVVLTGSDQTGRAVMRECADRLLPSTMELSGDDAAIVLPDADLDRVVGCLRFALEFNSGFSCIAPRRLLVHDAVADELIQTMQTAALMHPPIQRMPDEASIIAAVAGHPMRLGASVFGPLDMARRLAERLPVGSVVINDLMVPTADPRLPFGGAGRSGFGVTRGREGLLEMTRIQTIAVRRRGILFHLRPPRRNDREILEGQFQLAHGNFARRRAAGLVRIFHSIRA